jgi:2-dehydropantoate 2-reductase
MKIAVIGAGAIGGVVAAYLKKAGEDVVLVGHADQVNAVNAKGLTIKGSRGTETIKLPALTRLDKPYDLVIFAVKTQDLEEAYAHNSEFLESGLVLTTQNGVQADNILSSHFDRDRQLSSIVMFGATYIKPGEITFNFEGDWIIGRPLMPLDPVIHKVAEVLGKAFKAVTSTNIIGQKYLKLFVNFNNCIPALVGKSMQETFADMDLCRLSIMLLKEGLDTVTAANIELVSLRDFPKERVYGLVKMPVDQAAGIINKTLTGLSKEPLYGSILQSIMRSKTSEIDFINGEVVHIGNHLKLPVPLNSRMVDMVHEVERTRQYFTKEEVKKAFLINNVILTRESPVRGTGAGIQ